MAKGFLVNVERSAEIRELLIKINAVGISYSKISSDSGIDKTYISKFMHGHNDYTNQTLDKVEKALEKYKVLL